MQAAGVLGLPVSTHKLGPLPGGILNALTHCWPLCLLCPQAVAVLGLTVGIHELGHFLAAVTRGIHVTKFSIGFGPTLLKWQVRLSTADAPCCRACQQLLGGTAGAALARWPAQLLQR